MKPSINMSYSQARIAIDKKYLSDEEATDRFRVLLPDLKEFFLLKLPAEGKEGIDSWLEGCDEGFRKAFKTFLKLYKHRLEYSKGYEWENKLEDVISAEQIDSIFNLNYLDGLMLKNFRQIRATAVKVDGGYKTPEGLHLSDDRYNFSLLHREVLNSLNRQIGLRETTHKIWEVLFHRVVQLSVHIDISDKYSFAEGTDSYIGRFIKMLNLRKKEYKNLDSLSVFYHGGRIQSDPSVRQTVNSKKFKSSNQHLKKFENWATFKSYAIPPADSASYMADRFFVFHFNVEKTKGLIINIGHPSNIFSKDNKIKRETSSHYQSYEEEENFLERLKVWSSRFED